MSDSKCPTPEELSFGAALAELDQIVAELEGGQLELEESLERYERGVALLRSLQAQARRRAAEGDDAHRRARGRGRHGAGRALRPRATEPGEADGDPVLGRR